MTPARPMAFKKVPPALAAAFDAALPASPDVERRRMFGCPCAFVHGHMFAGVHEERLIVRLPDEAPSRPFAVMGRTMKEYAAFDAALDMPGDEMARWIAAAFQRTALLPPKAKKATTGKAVAKTGRAAAGRGAAGPSRRR